MKVSSETTCDLVPPNVPAHVFNPGRNLTEGSLTFQSCLNDLMWTKALSGSSFGVAVN